MTDQNVVHFTPSQTYSTEHHQHLDYSGKLLAMQQTNAQRLLV